MEHKNHYDMNTKIATLEEINGEGRDKQEQIKYYIKNFEHRYNRIINICYFVLVGP